MSTEDTREITERGDYKTTSKLSSLSRPFHPPPSPPLGSNRKKARESEDDLKDARSHPDSIAATTASNLNPPQAPTFATSSSSSSALTLDSADSTQRSSTKRRSGSDSEDADSSGPSSINPIRTRGAKKFKPARTFSLNPCPILLPEDYEVTQEELHQLLDPYEGVKSRTAEVGNLFPSQTSESRAARFKVSRPFHREEKREHLELGMDKLAVQCQEEQDAMDAACALIELTPGMTDAQRLKAIEGAVNLARSFRMDQPLEVDKNEFLQLIGEDEGRIEDLCRMLTEGMEYKLSESKWWKRVGSLRLKPFLAEDVEKEEEEEEDEQDEEEQLMTSTLSNSDSSDSVNPTQSRYTTSSSAAPASASASSSSSASPILKITLYIRSLSATVEQHLQWSAKYLKKFPGDRHRESPVNAHLSSYPDTSLVISRNYVGMSLVGDVAMRMEQDAKARRRGLLPVRMSNYIVATGTEDLFEGFEYLLPINVVESRFAGRDNRILNEGEQLLININRYGFNSAAGGSYYTFSPPPSLYRDIKLSIADFESNPSLRLDSPSFSETRSKITPASPNYLPLPHHPLSSFQNLSSSSTPSVTAVPISPDATMDDPIVIRETWMYASMLDERRKFRELHPHAALASDLGLERAARLAVAYSVDEFGRVDLVRVMKEVTREMLQDEMEFFGPGAGHGPASERRSRTLAYDWDTSALDPFKSDFVSIRKFFGGFRDVWTVTTTRRHLVIALAFLSRYMIVTRTIFLITVSSKNSYLLNDEFLRKIWRIDATVEDTRQFIELADSSSLDAIFDTTSSIPTCADNPIRDWFTCVGVISVVWIGPNQRAISLNQLHSGILKYNPDSQLIMMKLIALVEIKGRLARAVVEYLGPEGDEKSLIALVEIIEHVCVDTGLTAAIEDARAVVKNYNAVVGGLRMIGSNERKEEEEKEKLSVLAPIEELDELANDDPIAMVRTPPSSASILASSRSAPAPLAAVPSRSASTFDAPSVKSSGSSFPSEPAPTSGRISKPSSSKSAQQLFTSSSATSSSSSSSLSASSSSAVSGATSSTGRLELKDLAFLAVGKPHSDARVRQAQLLLLASRQNLKLRLTDFVPSPSQFPVDTEAWYEWIINLDEMTRLERSTQGYGKSKLANPDALLRQQKRHATEEGRALKAAGSAAIAASNKRRARGGKEWTNVPSLSTLLNLLADPHLSRSEDTSRRWIVKCPSCSASTLANAKSTEHVCSAKRNELEVAVAAAAVEEEKSNASSKGKGKGKAKEAVVNQKSDVIKLGATSQTNVPLLEKCPLMYAHQVFEHDDFGEDHEFLDRDEGGRKILREIMAGTHSIGREAVTAIIKRTPLLFDFATRDLTKLDLGFIYFKKLEEVEDEGESATDKNQVERKELEDWKCHQALSKVLVELGSERDDYFESKSWAWIDFQRRAEIFTTLPISNSINMKCCKNSACGTTRLEGKQKSGIKHYGPTKDSHTVTTIPYPTFLSLPRTMIRQIHSHSWRFSGKGKDAKYGDMYAATAKEMGVAIHEKWV